MTTHKIEQANVYLAPTGKRKAFLPERVTDQGVSGLGGAGVACGAGGKAAAQMPGEMVERFVLGEPAAAVTSIWQEIYERSLWTRNGGAITRPEPWLYTRCRA